jgi:hypothetical protein
MTEPHCFGRAAILSPSPFQDGFADEQNGFTGYANRCVGSPGDGAGPEIRPLAAPSAQPRAPAAWL